MLGYKIGIIIAPVIMLDDYKIQYKELIEYLYNNLDEKAKKEVFFEVIFMTYSYVHDKINTDAFIDAPKIFDKEKMKARGKYKYGYKEKYLEEGKEYIKELLKVYFTENEIKYIV